jgi:putative tricarboxylic transport membrane protein
MAAFGSFIAGTIGVVGLMIFAVPLSRFALRFGPPEYFAVILLGLTFVTYFSRGSMIKALMMASFGIILSSIGLDTITSTPRMTFDLIQLYDGLSIAPVGMGLFGIGEVLFNLEEGASAEVVKAKIKSYFPTKLDWMKSRGAILRGTVLGFFLGVLPGGGPVLSTFMSYGIEKKLSKEPETFGQGAIQGVAGPESANNSAASAAFIPLLTLGLPPNVVLSLMFGALLIHGVTPGPFLIQKNPDIFWGVISSMYIGNVMLLILNLPLIPLWVQVLRIPPRVLYPLILLFCLIGGYSLNNNILDVLIMIIFGILGYLFRKFQYEGAPLILAFVLGPIIESNLRQSLILSRGSFDIFFARPISAITLTITILLILSSIFPSFRRAKKKYEVTS